MKEKHLAIGTERLYLRQINEEDAFEIVELRADPAVYRYFTLPHKLTVEEHLAWYRNQYLLDNNRLDWIAFHDEKPVGIFGLKREHDSALEVEISYLLNQKEYGKGYANEAVSALLKWASSTWQSKTAVAKIHYGNKASIRFIERMGFQFWKEEEIFFIYKRDI